MAAEIAVVVPTHRRALRLRWLLLALGEQTLSGDRFETVVVHDGTDAETATVLADFPAVRTVEVAAGTGTPARQRNAGWRAVSAPLVAFTDDDCRPPREWLEAALRVARDNPGAIVQGATRPDPDEAALLRAPGARSLTVDPPELYAQTCNIVYPRELLDRLDGFDETFPDPAGEDTDLALRGQEAGAPYVGAPAALTYHAVHVSSLRGQLRSLPRWQHLALVVRRHPAARRALVFGVFWKPSHAWLTLALGGAALRRPAVTAVALAGWATAARPSYGTGPRARAREVAELPTRLAVDVAEMATAVRGSIRYRTLFL
jgi:GT2 family glycosyltransferase